MPNVRSYHAHTVDMRRQKLRRGDWKNPLRMKSVRWSCIIPSLLVWNSNKGQRVKLMIYHSRIWRDYRMQNKNFRNFESADGYHFRDGVLMRKWCPVSCNGRQSTSLWSHVPNEGRLWNLHVSRAFAGRLRAKKTLNRVWRNASWPGVHRDVVQYVNACHTCKVMGKPNHKLKDAPIVLNLHLKLRLTAL